MQRTIAEDFGAPLYPVRSPHASVREEDADDTWRSTSIAENKDIELGVLGTY